MIIIITVVSVISAARRNTVVAHVPLRHDRKRSPHDLSKMLQNFLYQKASNEYYSSRTIPRNKPEVRVEFYFIFPFRRKMNPCKNYKLEFLDKDISIKEICSKM